MSKFAEALAVPSRESKVDAILAELDHDDRAEALAALKDPRTPSAAIARALTKIGHPCGDNAIGIWRRRCGVL